ncbi:glutaredoxin domain-containing protein, partial [Veillonella sp.]
MLLVQYPTCTTCKKAKKYLESHNISFDDRNIKEENPTAEELGLWQPKSGKD